MLFGTPLAQSVEANMATIRKRGQRWHVQIRRQNHPSVTGTFSTRREALAWSRRKESEIDVHTNPVKNLLGNQTLGHLVQRYLHNEVPKKRGADVEATILKAFLRNDLAKTLLNNVTPNHFSIYRDQRLTYVKPATICRELAIYQHMFGVAILEWGLPFPRNPHH